MATVADSGRGFDADRVRSRPGAALHFGLDTLAERVQAAGGEIVIASTPGRGTAVRVSLPVLADDHSP